MFVRWDVAFRHAERTARVTGRRYRVYRFSVEMYGELVRMWRVTPV